MAHAKILSTWSFSKYASAAAWPLLSSGGDPLDVAEMMTTAIEADSDVDSVGFGGLPDTNGNVTLDACVMRSPAQVGAVCIVSRHLAATTLARRVMENTSFVMLGGNGADSFAESEGLAEAELVSPAAKKRFDEWKRSPRPTDQSIDASFIRPIDTGEHGRLFEVEPPHDTVCVLALNSGGDLAGACTTSGAPWKRPGRIGDSPIPGHGLYVDPRFGAAAATGTGELVMGSCSSFAVVEAMRRGASPLEAVRLGLTRLAEDHEISDGQQVALIAIDPAGTHASGALKSGYLSVVTDDSGTRLEPSDVVLIPESGNASAGP